MESVGFRHFAKRSPHHLAVAAPDGRHWTRGELCIEADQLARGLQSTGLASGDTVAVLLPNCTEFIAIRLATEQLDCEFQPIDCRLTPAEATKRLRDSGASLLLSHEHIGSAAAQLAADATTARVSVFTIGSLEGFRPYSELLVALDGTDPEEFQSRSGEGCGATKALDPEPAVAQAKELMGSYGILPEQHNIHYCGCPLDCTDVMKWTIASLHYGHPIVLAGEWEAQQMLQAVEQYRVTTSYLVSNQFADLLSLPDEIRSCYDISSIRHLLHDSTPCPPQVRQAIRDWWGV